MAIQFEGVEMVMVIVGHPYNYLAVFVATHEEAIILREGEGVYLGGVLLQIELGGLLLDKLRLFVVVAPFPDGAVLTSAKDVLGTVCE